MTRSATRVFGLLCVAFALLCVVVWIPLDTDSGLVEQVRRRISVGDALAPTLAACFVLLGGILTTLFGRDTTLTQHAVPGAVSFGAKMLGVLVIGFLIALYAGPIAVAIYNITQADPLEYRLVRASFPWKYVGFVLGGTCAIAGCIALAEERLHGRAILIGLLAVLGMIVLFDLPFDDLLLPPNGDY